MKTTVEISDPLFEQVRALAASEGTTLRELVEAGLRLVLRDRPQRQGFSLRDARFKGRGLQHEYRDGRWDETRVAIYPTDERAK